MVKEAEVQIPVPKRSPLTPVSFLCAIVLSGICMLLMDCTPNTRD